jgi:NAD-dependent deacetylase
MKGLLSGRRSGLIPWTAIEMLKNARSVTVITGSGMAIESGIPGVRGLNAAAGGGEIAVFSPGSFDAHPEIVWDAIKKTQEAIVSMSLPESYRVLAEMEDFWMDFHLITENVDGLHSIAGNKKILEIYGNIFKSRCIAEGKVIDTGLKTAPADPLERKCSCGSPLRPDVLWLGEEMDESIKTGVGNALLGSSVIMIMGASFHRFKELVRKAKEGGALVIEAHPSAPLYSDIASVCLQKSIGFVLPLIWREVKA